MKKLLLTLFVSAIIAVAPVNAQSVDLTFPGYSPYGSTVGWLYCDSSTCYLSTPFGTIDGPDMAYVWLMNPYFWAMVSDYLGWFE